MLARADQGLSAGDRRRRLQLLRLALLRLARGAGVGACLLQLLYGALWVRSVGGLAPPLLPGTRRPCVSFAGGGFLCLYGFGAVRALMHAPGLAGWEATGSSIGSWVAAAFLYLQGLPTPEEREEEWRRIVDRIAAFSEENRTDWVWKRLRFVDDSVVAFLRPCLELQGAFESCQGRLHVPIAHVGLAPPGLQLRVWSSFRDVAHLEEVLVAGASIPGVQDWPPRRLPSAFEGLEGPPRGWGVDAGALDNSPRLTAEGTLRVNWIAPAKADIHPRVLLL